MVSQFDLSSLLNFICIPESCCSPDPNITISLSTMALVVLIGGLVALIFFYNLWRMRTKYPKIKDIKAPEAAGAWPVIGHIHLLLSKDPTALVLGAMADKYGSAFTFRLGVHRILVLSNSDLIKECLTTNDRVLATRPSTVHGKYLGYNYALLGMAPYGPYWCEIRKLVTLELLSAQRLEMFKHVPAREIDTSTKELYLQWVKKGERSIKVEMKQWFEDITLNVITMLVAGKKCSVQDGARASSARKAITEYMYLSGVFVVSDALPCLEWLDMHGYISSMKRVAKDIDYLIESWLQEERKKSLYGEKEGRHNFISVMLSVLAGDDDIFGYDRDTVIKATVLNLIIAGSNTTAITLTWALSLILNNPRVLKIAQNELDIQVGRERQVDETDIKNLVYLQAIVRETLRLYPPAPISVPREVMEDCKIGEYHVPKGTLLIVNLWKLHRDTHTWSDPNEFQPERFLKNQGDVDVKDQQFEYIPFSFGRRGCPGVKFGLHIMQLTLARLLHEFNLTTPLNTLVDMTESFGFTMPKATLLEVLLNPRLPINVYE